MNKRLHAYISGRVQGVYFRDTTQRRALELGVVGWTRNLDDGRVEVVAEGDSHQLEALLEFLHRGSPMSRVDDVRHEILDATGEYLEFLVRR